MSIKCMNYVWEQSQTKGADRLMLLAIADSCNDDGEWAPGVARLAEKCGVTDRAAQYTLRRLEDQGELAVLAGEGFPTKNGRTNKYVMKRYREAQSIAGVKPVAPLINNGVKPIAPLGPQGVKPVAPQGVKPVAPEPSVLPTSTVSTRKENTRACEADSPPLSFQPLPAIEEIQPMPASAPTIETHAVQAAVSTPPVARPLPAHLRQAQVPATTGDPLIDIAAAKFAGRQRGREFANAWQAELNQEVPATERVPIAQKLAEIWGMAASIDAGNDGANRTCHEVAVRLCKANLVKAPSDLDVHYQAYLADDWRRQHAPQPKPEKFEAFISQSVAAMSAGLNQLKGQASHANTTNHRNSVGGGRTEQPHYPAGSTAPDFSRYNRNKANRQPSTGA